MHRPFHRRALAAADALVVAVALGRDHHQHAFAAPVADVVAEILRHRLLAAGQQEHRQAGEQEAPGGAGRERVHLPSRATRALSAAWQSGEYQPSMKPASSAWLNPARAAT